ncbi:thioredoxin-like protein Clot [Musa acuminata AAA Group]|uniref:thioredoxin-like protein Clot n=1 Tax=Musa acuminata AAA Group TaxID=214697 RepID=UPI0031D8FC0A
MPLKTFDADLSNFDQVFEGFTKSETTEGSPSEPGQLKFLLFLADKDPSTNRSWCPDCNVAEPIIYEKLEASNINLVLLRAYVGDRPTWRNPSHPWRVDPRFKLMGVPTLIRWENEAVAGRLEDYEAHIGDKIDSILASN